MVRVFERPASEGRANVVVAAPVIKLRLFMVSLDWVEGYAWGQLEVDSEAVTPPAAEPSCVPRTAAQSCEDGITPRLACGPSGRFGQVRSFCARRIPGFVPIFRKPDFGDSIQVPETWVLTTSNTRRRRCSR
jgi:hypothetical protein